MGAGGIRHFAQAQIKTLCQENVQQTNLVTARGTGVQMREGFGKAGVVVDLRKNIGDPRFRQTAVKVEHEVTGLLGDICLKTFDAQDAVFNDPTWQRFGARGLSQPFQPVL